MTASTRPHAFCWSSWRTWLWHARPRTTPAGERTEDHSNHRGFSGGKLRGDVSHNRADQQSGRNQAAFSMEIARDGGSLVPAAAARHGQALARRQCAKRCAGVEALKALADQDKRPKEIAARSSQAMPQNQNRSTIISRISPPGPTRYSRSSKPTRISRPGTGACPVDASEFSRPSHQRAKLSGIRRRQRCPNRRRHPDQPRSGRGCSRAGRWRQRVPLRRPRYGADRRLHGGHVPVPSCA
jgi:hypothetical protein